MQPTNWMHTMGVWILQGGTAGYLGVQQVVSAPWRWRHRYSGLTCYMTASALNDQGTVFAASVPSDAFAAGLSCNGSVSPNGDPAVFGHVAAALPLDENVLQLISPKPYVAPARGGVYIPAKFLGPDFSFVKPEFVDGRAIQSTFFSLQTYLPYGANSNIGIYGCNDYSVPIVPKWFTAQQGNTGPDGSTGTVYQGSWVPSQVLNPGGIANPLMPSLDSGLSRMTTGVVIFRGLSPAASITVRTMVGLEVVPRTDSTQRQFVRTASLFVPRALQAYHEIATLLDDVYPASFNALGLLASVIGSIVPRIVPMLRGVLGAAPAVLRGVQGAVEVGSQVRDSYRAASRGPALSETQRVSVSDPRPARVQMSTPSVRSSVSRSRSRSVSKPRSAMKRQQPKRRGRK
jgi:hypothetical protein